MATRAPKPDQMTSKDAYFADMVLRFQDTASNFGIVDNNGAISADYVNRIAGAVGISLRSRSGKDLEGIFRELGIWDAIIERLGAGESLGYSVTRHDHNNWSVSDDTPPDAEVWSAKCLEPGCTVVLRLTKDDALRPAV